MLEKTLPSKCHQASKTWTPKLGLYHKYLEEGQNKHNRDKARRTSFRGDNRQLRNIKQHMMREQLKMERTMAKSPGFSSAHLPSAWDWSSCPEPDPHSLHCPQMEVVAVEEEVQEREDADPQIYRVSFHHYQVPFLVKCPSLDVSSLS